MILTKKKKILICKIASRVFGLSATLECFNGYPIVAGFSVVAIGVIVEYQNYLTGDVQAQ